MRGGARNQEKNNLRVTQKYYEIHAINSDKAIGQYILSGYRQPHRVQCLGGCEVTRKNTVGSRGGHVPQCPIPGNANG